ncbi:MAG: PaaI family thioesterase [Panacagrimonas sp.]
MNVELATLQMPRSVEDLASFLQAIPYARLLGLSSQRDGDDVILRMPFHQDLIGNARLRAVHGGALGALLEFAALCQLMSVVEVTAFPKIVNITAEYLRGTQPDRDTFARATVTRHGRRVANVRAIAYQADASKPVAAANAHFLLAV